MDKIIKVDDFEIGGDRCYIIADVGSNHNQDLSIALESIHAAAENGAHAVKFQSLNQDKLYHSPSQDIKEFYKKIDLNERWYTDLKNQADKSGITFFSSPTYMESIDLLEAQNVQIYKLASAQVGVFPQIAESVARLNKPVIISTGLVTYGELENIVRIFEKVNNEKLIILHCNSIYPTPHEEVMIDLMSTYRSMFDCITGFSDHTLGNYASFAAVARGAKVIERHFTLSKKIDTPDLIVAIDPDELSDLSRGIRAIEDTINHLAPRTVIHPEEQGFKNTLTYRVFADQNIDRGDKANEVKFKFLRHDEGLDCNTFYQMDPSEYSMNRPVQKGEVLNINDFKKVIDIS